jgi:Fanconi-associated nuclease 1
LILSFGSSSTASIVTHFSDTDIDESKVKKLWTSIHQHLGPCIKVNEAIYILFQRLLIVYYRINSLQNPSPISSSILAKTSKRNYPEYTFCRSASIWRSRYDLIQYEQALQVELAFQKNLENLSRPNAVKTNKCISAECGDIATRQLMIESWTLCEDYIGIFDECVEEANTQERPYYLRRFEAGWVYTRLIDHGTEILAKLHEYELEALILQKLLNQQIYRLGRRGKWYERLALVQTLYLNKDQPRLQKKAALKTCIDAIHDPRVHQSKCLNMNRYFQMIH